jgi:hypothetical protein
MRKMGAEQDLAGPLWRGNQLVEPLLDLLADLVSDGTHGAELEASGS